MLDSLSVQDYSKSSELIMMAFSGNVEVLTKNKWFHFGGDLDNQSVSGVLAECSVRVLLVRFLISLSLNKQFILITFRCCIMYHKFYFSREVKGKTTDIETHFN